ncbi:MAG TPA: acyl transferase [Chitinophagaceae bacterium]|nr:acyl transferase [Chitinophagaceae bacterium]
MKGEWHDKIFSVTKGGFRQLALDIFHFQYGANKVYNSYVNALGKTPSAIDEIEKIPFLPISFFKTDEIKTGRFNAEVIFKSSGTMQSINSQHHVKDVSIYIQSFTRAFEKMYGELKEWCILGLLPSYLEKGDSSLVYMVDNFIKQSQHAQSDFYLYDLDKLKETLLSLERSNQKTLLIGVTYALLDFAEKFPMALKNTIIMETGGMKGRREELTRMEVHERLSKAFGNTEIHSEYGMTELLSQAYAKKQGRFQCPPWMRILIRDDEDPLTVRSSESGVVSGAINIIDLANVYSCSFIATDDVGKLYADKSFEVLGRMDGSDLRGCSLLTV